MPRITHKISKFIKKKFTKVSFEFIGAITRCCSHKIVYGKKHFHWLVLFSPQVLIIADDFNFLLMKIFLNSFSYLILGLAGLATVLGVAAYKFKTKGNMSTSVFLMQTRVAAQGAVVACLTLGLAYTMFNQHILHKEVKALKGEKVE